MYTEPLHLMSLLIQYFSARVEHAVTCYVLQGVLSLFRSLAHSRKSVANPLFQHGCHYCEELGYLSASYCTFLAGIKDP